MDQAYQTLLAHIRSSESKPELYAVLDAVALRLRELDEIPPGWMTEEEFTVELEKRIKEIESGEVKTVPGEQVMEELRRLAP